MFFVIVHESFNEIRAMKRLLNGLMSSLQRQSRDKLFCSKTLWLQCISRVRVWQKELKQIQVPRVSPKTLFDSLLSIIKSFYYSKLF